MPATELLAMVGIKRPLGAEVSVDILLAVSQGCGLELNDIIWEDQKIRTK